MKYNTRQELGLQILSQAIFGIATGYTSGSAPVAAYNAVLGAGIYTIGEQEHGTKPGLIASGTKLYGPDKWLGLYSSSVKNLTGRAFAKDFFMGRSGFLAGTTVTVITAMLDLTANSLEENLEIENINYLEDSERQKNNHILNVLSSDYDKR